jgi:hypothetical protein
MLAGLDPGRGGGLLHCRLRYFDPINHRAGIPPDVAALIDQMTADYVAVTLVNVSQTQSRQLVVQTGAYAEHECTSVVLGNRQIPVDQSCFTVSLAPGAGARIVVRTRRYSNTPTSAFPWDRAN